MNISFKKDIGLYLMQLNESGGTIQYYYDTPEYEDYQSSLKFINNIKTDIYKKSYQKYPLLKASVEKQKSYNKIYLAYNNEYNLYLLEYKSVDCLWINNFDIIVFEKKPDDEINNVDFFRNPIVAANKLPVNFDAFALNRDSTITKFNNHGIQSGCILIMARNSMDLFTVRENLFHEFNHYYMDYEQYCSTALELSNDKFYNEHYPEYEYWKRVQEQRGSKDFPKIWNSRFYNKVIASIDNSNDVNIIVSNLYGLIVQMCYFLNDIEINGNKENVFSDILKFYINNGYVPRKLNDDKFVLNDSEYKHYLLYLNILNLLDYIKEHCLTKEICTKFNNRYGVEFYKVFIEKNYEDKCDVIVLKAFGLNKIMHVFSCRTKELKDKIMKMFAFVPYVEV